MFDALQDTSRDFQTKLIDALNSLSQTMGVAPEDAFNQVLCASKDDNQDVKKKLYNWWRAFFEVLGKVSDGKVPKDRESEFNQKIDDLMAEIMKAGDAESKEDEVVMEAEEDLGYQQANKSDEDEMLKDFDFAVQHIGEIANRVKDIVNFVNPYCESGNEEDTSMEEKALTKDELVKLVRSSKTDEMEVNSWRSVKGMNLVEFDVFVKNTGQLGDEPATSVADIVDVVKDVVGEVVSKAGWDFDVFPVNDDITVQMWNGEDFDGKVDVYNDETRLGDSDGAMFKVVCRKYDMDDDNDNNNRTMKDNITSERGDSEWISMDDIVGKEFGESDNGETFWKAMDDVDDLERKGYWSGKFKVGDKVNWIAPEYPDEPSTGWEVVDAPEDDGVVDPDDIYVIVNNETGSEAEVLGSELRPAKMVKEASVVVDANDVWDVLDLLDDPDANKNLTDLINSHVRTEEEIMDAIDTVYPDNIRKGELNAYMNDSFYEIVDELGLDVEKFKETGEFVDPEKPVALEGSDEEQKPDEIKDGEKKYKKDGETKTLVTGSDKQVVNEMTIEQEIDDPWKLLELLWGQGRENFRDLLESELIDDDTLMMMLEDMEIKNLTSINDAFAYDFPTILDMLGLDGEAWSQNLEIKRKED